MATDFWGSDEIESDGNYDVGGGDFPVIPDGTRVKALIEKVELFDEDNKKFNYKTGLDEECISVRFDIEEGEFKGQKMFPIVKCTSPIDSPRRRSSLNP